MYKRKLRNGERDSGGKRVGQRLMTLAKMCCVATGMGYVFCGSVVRQTREGREELPRG